MANKDIIQNIIFQLGQSQDDRLLQELEIHFADVDERTPEELLLFTKKIAEFVNYYQNNIAAPTNNWSAFFPYNQTELKQLIENKNADISPHLALLLGFLEVYKQPQEVINQITANHLDFYYKDVLRLQQKSAVADKVHLLIELKKNAAPINISPTDLFSAGKDNTGIELIYVPTRETVINISQVDSLRSIFLDNDGAGTVRYAPIANSTDGLGGKLPGDEGKWFGFGNQNLPAAEVGFAIASPVLRMQEGTRKVIVNLQLNNLDKTKLNNTLLVGAFEVFITSEKSWLGPFIISPILINNNVLTFNFTVRESDKAVIDYDAAIHGYSYHTQSPIIQVLLKAGNTKIGYKSFQNVTLQKAKITVEVSGITSLQLESDSGGLDAKKVFIPFGFQATKGSRFIVGYAEALTKKLAEVSIKVLWKDAPANFATHYSGYGTSVDNKYFTATVYFKDGGTWENTSYGQHLFNSNNASFEQIFTFTRGSSSASPSITEGMKLYALSRSGSFWARNVARKYVLQKPVFSSFQTVAPEGRTGFITFSLEKDFLHSTYRQKYIENVMTYRVRRKVFTLLNEPYTPTIQNISLSYQAYSDEVNIASNLLNEFANSDLQFFHIAYFGQMREHGYQRQQINFLADKSVSLLPAYTHEGELLIGFSKLNPGDSVSVLFQVAEGSANPELNQEDITWFVLCDNYWKQLSRSEVILDTTNQLLTSGIIKFVIPTETTTSNTILPGDRIWIKAAVAQNVDAISQLIEVAANAVEVQFKNGGNDSQHLLIALQKGKITKLKNGLSPIKSVQQPFASFGGKPVETNKTFYTRVSERLRHKNRCITAWDYERIILEAFPNVYKVKCIPHAKENSWLAPGNVLIVVIPDLKNKNAINRLQPKVDADTISRITAYVQERVGMQVKIKVKNPRYQKIQVDFKVQFYTGYEFNYYSTALKQELVQFLSPWAYTTDRDILFGGKIYKSVLLDFVEDLNYVDYVTDFKMYSYIGNSNNYIDINEVQPETPDSILVSDDTHIINKII
ncbi:MULTISPECIES: baseplate J/gp47 family protein [Nostoc]|uniref:Baseplate J/gp47 family protein n=2 Tax=Nostoc TaxID=1177 RepID=A0ABR8IFQ6_9NOSO|nr:MULTISPECIES: baseplate J/gp47 family protein [Nostoc]MBD2563977.1 baseplate J/gp47 family protein [Nostoc linckia FACHB-391]MBD2650435.1 baseplate J/gp47 family protein [Nostoc foliaceum FACHB-393]